MSAVFTPTRYKLSVEDYHKLGAAGVLTEDSRVELIDGELIAMAPIGPKHASVVDTLVGLLAPQAGKQFRLSTQNPLTLMPSTSRSTANQALAGIRKGPNSGRRM